MKDTTLMVPTERCLLRPATDGDYDAMAAGIGAPQFPHDLPLSHLHSQGKLKTWLDSMLAMSLDAKACLLSIDLRTGERCVGQVSLVQREKSVSWNLAFWLHPCRWGTGLAVEAAAATIQYAFTVMAIAEVWAGAALWNQASIKTLSQLGLQQIGEIETLSGAAGVANIFQTFSLTRECWMRTRCESHLDPRSRSNL